MPLQGAEEGACIDCVLCPVAGVHRNLLVRFARDSIDETPALATMLQANSSISAQLDLTVRHHAACPELHSSRTNLPGAEDVNQSQWSVT